MKKIAFVKFGEIEFSEIDQWTQTIAEKLPKDQYEVAYFCPNQPFPYKTKLLNSLQKNGVRLCEFKVENKQFFGSIDITLAETFRETDYDLVCTADSSEQNHLSSLLKNVPVIEFATSIDHIKNEKNIIKSIHPSSFQANSWIAAGGESFKVNVIPVFADLPDHTKLGNLRSELNLKVSDFVVGFHQKPDLGSVSPIPLRAYKTQETENTCFVLFGGDPLYSEIASELEIKRFVQLPYSENPEDIHRFLNTLDIFAHGKAEGEIFGYSLVEALSHGLPCVSHIAPNRGHIETIGPGGVVVDSLDGYVAFLKTIKVDNAMYMHYSKAAKTHYETNLSVTRGMAQILEVFGNVIRTEELKRQDPEEFWKEMY